MDPRQRGDSKVSKLEPSNIKMLKLQPSIVLQQQSRVPSLWEPRKEKLDYLIRTCSGYVYRTAA